MPFLLSPLCNECNEWEANYRLKVDHSTTDGKTFRWIFCKFLEQFFKHSSVYNYSSSASNQIFWNYDPKFSETFWYFVSSTTLLFPKCLLCQNYWKTTTSITTTIMRYENFLQKIWVRLRDHYLVRTQNYNFLSPDTHTYVCVSGDKKCYFLGNFAYVLNIWSLTEVFAITSAVWRIN